MKLKIRLALVISALTAMVIAALSVTLLSRTRSLQIRMAQDNMKSSSGLHAENLDSYYEEFMSAASFLSLLMSDYQNVELQLRRTRYTEELRALITQNPNFYGIYTIWTPGLPDGRDAYYRGAPGCGADGSFAPYYRRENDGLEFNTTPDYQNILKNFSGDQEISAPEKISSNGSSHFVVHFRSPIKDLKGELIGLTGVIADFEYSRSLVQSIKPYGAGRAEMYTANGTIAASFDDALIGSRFQDVKIERFGKAGIAALEASFQNGEPALFVNRDIIVQGYPFRIGSSHEMWMFVSSVPVASVLKDVNAMTRFSIIIAVVSLLLAGCAGFIVAHRIAKPVSGVALTLKDISEGEGDLTRSITVKRTDEIGILARCFNLTLEKIRKLIITIKNRSHNLLNIGEELSSNMNETAAAVNEITANIQSIKTRVVNQSAIVTGANSAMEQITAGIDKLNRNTEALNAEAAKFSSAIEEMIANIQSVTNTLIKNTDNIKNLTRASELGRTGIQEVAMDIQGIARESESLLAINEMMKNIAGQTNLLSMNAAIEASHAGEAGKGFAVVAGEIRKLAESSAEQSKTISDGIKKITGSINRIGKSTADVLGKFEAIDGGVKIVAGQESHIRSAMEEQSAGSRQIMEAAGSLNDIIRQVRESAAAMLAGSKAVIQESKNLEMVTQEISAGMNEMAAGANQINAAVNEVNAISGRNRENINALAQEVSQFKVD
jgi:methyl-accepting chemotaxis protein